MYFSFSFVANKKVLSLYFQVGMYTYISKAFTPEKYEKKEKIRNCFLRPSGAVRIDVADFR